MSFNIDLSGTGLVESRYGCYGVGSSTTDEEDFS